jgi:hypothetical protein
LKEIKSLTEEEEDEIKKISIVRLQVEWKLHITHCMLKEETKTKIAVEGMQERLEV